MSPHARSATDQTSVDPAGGCYGLLRALVDRQVQTLEAVYPGLMDVVDMRPVEHWCVWGALLELMDDDFDRVRREFEVYVQRREHVSIGRAREIAAAVGRATAIAHSLADGIALAGREAVRTGFDRCFLAAAMYLRGPGRVDS